MPPTALKILESHPTMLLASRGALATLAPKCEVVQVASGDLLVRPLSVHRGVYVLSAGTLEVSRKNHQRKSQMLIGLMRSPGIFGDAELHAGRAKWGLIAKAVGEVTAALIPNAVFLDFVRSEPAVSYRMYVDSISRFMLAMDMMEVFALHDIKDKIARLLWSISRRSPSKDAPAVASLSPIQLARALGVTAKTIQRNLTSMEKDGWILRKGDRVELLIPEHEVYAGQPEMPRIASQWRLAEEDGD